MATKQSIINNSSSAAAHMGESGTADEFSYSTDKQDRKRLRKKRIEHKSSTDTTIKKITVDTVDDDTKKGSHQVKESLSYLDRRKYKGIQDITSLRVNFEEIESNRRIEDELLRRERLLKLQTEATNSSKANAGIEIKWTELLEKEISQELYSDIQQQVVLCNTIIKSKDDLIKEFQLQLRAKDEEYIKLLRQQADEIEELLNRIRNEYRILSGEYEKELVKIEETFDNEREMLINAHIAEIENLFKIRRNKEIFYKENKQKREELYQCDIDELLRKGSNQYTTLKIELELNIQTLKEQLEEIRATYQLNTEKLDYNYRVLTELDIEKHAELNQYKRKETKLKDQFNQLSLKYIELERNNTKLNTELTQDYRNLTTKYKELQTKFRQFEITDKGKFQEIWNMHEDTVNDQLDQLLKADKLITEQQLGYQWRQPDQGSLQLILSRYNINHNSQLDAQPNSPDGPGAGNAFAESNATHPASSQQQQITRNKNRIRAVLKMLSMETGFLLSNEVNDVLDKMNHELYMKDIENILRILGIKNEEKLKLLVSYFFVDPNSQSNNATPLHAGSAADGFRGPRSELQQLQEDPVEEDDNETQLFLQNIAEDFNEMKDIINPDHIIKSLTLFLEDISLDNSASITLNQDDERIGQKRLNHMKNYWNTLAQIVPDESTHVWKQLELHYGHMKEVLENRSTAIKEVDDLNAKNLELKRLLNQYLGDKTVNNTLQVPPSQVMKVRNVNIAATTKK